MFYNSDPNIVIRSGDRILLKGGHQHDTWAWICCSGVFLRSTMVNPPSNHHLGQYCLLNCSKHLKQI